MRIHVIGDSHTNVFREIKNPFVVRGNFPYTAHNLYKKNDIKKILEEGFESYDKVLFIFGEIDCRLHIYYQFIRRNFRNTLDEIIDETIINYKNFLLNCSRDFIVADIVPAGTWNDSPSYDNISTPLSIKIVIHNEFHKKLRQMCIENNFKLLDIWDDIISEDMTTRKELKCDDVHLSSTAIPIILNGISKCLPEYKEEIIKSYVR